MVEEIKGPTCIQYGNMVKGCVVGESATIATRLKAVAYYVSQTVLIARAIEILF
jgi:hypothetical protein